MAGGTPLRSLSLHPCLLKDCLRAGRRRNFSAFFYPTLATRLRPEGRNSSSTCVASRTDYAPPRG